MLLNLVIVNKYKTCKLLNIKDMMNNLQASAFVAKNLLNVLQGYTKGIRFLLVMFLTLTVSAEVWGANASHTCSNTSGTIVSSKITFTTTSATWNSPQCRIAANGSITFTLTGVSVTKIAMGFSSSGYVGSWTSSGGGSFSTNSTTVTWTGSANPGTLTFTTSSAARLKTISVTYETAASYTVTWTINPTAGGTLSAPSGNSTTVSPNAAYTYGNPAYKVTSGSATVSQSGNTFTATPTANSTIQINMVEKPKYTVTFDAGSNGTCSTTSLTETSAGAGVKLPDVTPNTGYRFLGWATYSSATTANAGTAGATYKPTSNITLYAVYKQQCTITWLVDGNAAEGSPTTKVDKGGKVATLPTTPTLDCSGKTFVGWSNQEVTDGNKPSVLFTSAANSPTINDNTTFRAVFAKKTTTTGESSSKDYSFNITKGDFNSTSYAANNNEKTSTATASDGSSTMEVNWTSYQVMNQSSTMQWQSSKGYIYNSTDLGTIKDITITSTAGTFTKYINDSQQPTSNGTGGYFQIKVGNTTGKVSNIKVTFTQTIKTPDVTTYSDYTTQCSTQTVVTLIPKNGLSAHH